ncbi:MAG TPA: phenylacetate--CoA ligase [Candidatus Avimonas sp.]|jgi:phenylacetate-CoA ligase|nr:phenylacetate--CoA ligase [Candidatus Avimonas sp.]HQA15694.1 phenylacetate--CoA ligase [Candidatus Avimonas sp.]HQD37859.1 phenylacetate--CoA ligase [Candidatus Avimonas sp.]
MIIKNRIWNREMECMPRRRLEELQLERLRALVDYCYRNVEFYHRRLSEAGVTADKIKTLSDVQYIPYTTKDDLRDNYPFGMFSVPIKDIVRIHASSGTTGNPTVVGYTREDMENWSEQVARIVVAAGASENSIVQICFGYGMFTGALGLHYGLEKIGAAVVPTSSGNTQKQLKFMRDFGTNTIVATPSYCMYLAETAREMSGEYPMDMYKLKLGLLGSEGCTPEMREQIEQRWGNGFFVTDNYGMSELNGPGLSGECVERCGMHINEDHFLCEVIDPDTLEVTDRGETGELVVTALTKRGIPMLRYRTKDITKLDYEPCRCGRTTARMHKIIGRSDDMLIIRGVNVFPSQVESALIGINEISPHYQLVVRRKNYIDTLEVRVELIDGSLLERYAELEALQRRIHDRIKTILGIEIEVSLVEPKSIERFTGKAQRVVDLRK